MIRSFQSKALKVFVHKGDASKLPVQNHRRVREILAVLQSAKHPADMNLPGYKWHDLSPGRPGVYAVWVTGNWRITFRFDGADAVDVNIEDYH